MNGLLPENYARPQELNLWNVNNTSDMQKPVSTAGQTALDDKLDVEDGTIIGPDGLLFKRFDASDPQFQIRSGINETAFDSLDGKTMSIRLVDGNTEALCIQNLGDGNANLWCIDTLDDKIVHSTNRQVNSQPIAVQGHHSGVSVTADCSLKQSTYVVTNTSDVTFTLTNPYKGKVIRICRTSTTGRTLLPVIAISYKYENTILSTKSSGLGRGFDLICVDDGTVLIWMVSDN